MPTERATWSRYTSICPDRSSNALCVLICLPGCNSEKAISDRMCNYRRKSAQNSIYLCHPLFLSIVTDWDWRSFFAEGGHDCWYCTIHGFIIMAGMRGLIVIALLIHWSYWREALVSAQNRLHSFRPIAAPAYSQLRDLICQLYIDVCYLVERPSRQYCASKINAPDVSCWAALIYSNDILH